MSPCVCVQVSSPGQVACLHWSLSGAHMGGTDQEDSSAGGGDIHMRRRGTQGHSSHTSREVFSSLRLGYNVIFRRWWGYITPEIVLLPPTVPQSDHIFHTTSHPIHFQIFSPQNFETFYHKAINILKFSHTTLYICVYTALKIESVIHISIVDCGALEPWFEKFTSNGFYISIF